MDDALRHANKRKFNPEKTLKVLNIYITAKYSTRVDLCIMQRLRMLHNLHSTQLC